MISNILVADTDPKTIDLCNHYLTEKNLLDTFEIVPVTDGEDALTVLKAEVFRLVIADLDISGQSVVTGLDLLQTVRTGKTISDANIPVIMVSTTFSADQQATAILHKVSALRPKPLNAESFFQVLASLITTERYTPQDKRAALTHRRTKILETLTALDTLLPRALENTWEVMDFDVTKLAKTHQDRLQQKQTLREQLRAINAQLGT
ncbi:MAG: response regulator [Magnetospirillum sp.]|nr:response regulator [Magnetospirillum sp.]